MDQDSSYPKDLNLQRTVAVDLLEIYHARQVRGSIVSQLQRLQAHDEWPRSDGLCTGELSVFYEMLLLNVDHLLHTLGDADRV